MAGAGKRVIAYIPEMVEPELMYKLFDAVVGDLDELVTYSGAYPPSLRRPKSSVTN